MKSVYLKEDLHNIAAFIDGQLNLGGSRIMVTGCTGLIGSLIVKSLLEYNKISKVPVKIIGLARSRKKIEEVFSDEIDEAILDNTEFIYQDIKEPLPNGLGANYIINTASPTASSFFMQSPVDVMESIILGHRSILEYAKNNRVEGIVYLSSMEAFGVVSDGKIRGEKELGYVDLEKIRSCYPEAKRAAELLSFLYYHQYGIPAKNARLAQVFGAGILRTENRVFSQFAKSAMKGEDIVLHTEGNSIGNYCYTADAVKAILYIMYYGQNGETYTVVNEQNAISIVDMARMVAEKFSEGRSSVAFDIPESNQYGYAPDTLLRLSSKKLRSLGWKPEYSLVEMYRRMMPDIAYITSLST